MELLQRYFLLFIAYSVLGWCMETIYASIQNKRFVDRGFLLGPYCPIYGFGSLLIILLAQFAKGPIILFVLTMVVCGILEYITSWGMEKIFKARWWDYSKKKFNINGRVCLRNLLIFGVLGLIVNYILNPFLKDIIYKLSSMQLLVISTVIFVIYMIDSVVSFVVIFGFRKTTKQVNYAKKADNTEQITQMVRQLLSEKSFLHRRFINAYPKLQAIQIKIKEIKEKMDVVKNDVKEATEEKKEALKNRIDDIQNEALEKWEENLKDKKIKLYLGKRYWHNKFKSKNYKIERKKKE